MTNASHILADRLLVLFDGHCALCHASVRWLLRRDRRDRLRFSPSDSDAARSILAETISVDDFQANASLTPVEFAAPGTILVLSPPDASQQSPRLLMRSTAVLACLAELDSPWPQLAALARHIPLPLRDSAYRLVAHLRYRLARRYDTCPLPPPQHRHRFLA